MTFLRLVDQRNEQDSCRCCIASVTGYPYEFVPEFKDSLWRVSLRNWLKQFNLGLLYFQAAGEFLTPVWLPLMLKGPTLRGPEHHCVVFIAGRVFDPHPSRVGLTETKEAYAVVSNTLGLQLQ